MNVLEQALIPIRKRMRAQRVFSWTVFGLLAGTACVLLFRVASYLWAFSAVLEWSVLVLIAFPMLFALAAWLWPVTSMNAARRADAFGLHARVQTALMLKHSDTPMADLQRKDTIQCLSQLDAKEKLPLRAPMTAVIGLLSCTLVFGASFLIPNPQKTVLKAKAAFQSEMKKQADLVEEEVVKLDAKEMQTPELRKLLGDLARELRKANHPKAALSALDDTERKLEMLKKATGAETLKALKANGQSKLAQALETHNAAAAKQLLEQQNAQAVGMALAQAAESATDATAAQALSKAAQAMQSGNTAQALQDLQNAAMGQCSATQQATALGSLVRNATARAGAQQAAAMQVAGISAGTMLGSMGQGGQAGQMGMMGAGAGTGSSNKNGGYTSATAAMTAKGNRPPTLKTETYEAIYDPTRLGGGGDVVNGHGKQNEGETNEMTIGTGLGNMDGSVPYTKVLPQYRQSAVQSSLNADLPAYAQKWVEAYFDSLSE